MIFITGPLYAGKKDYIREALGLSEEDFHEKAVWDVEEFALTESPELLAEKLARYEIVIANEVGGGLVPVTPEEREKREAAGRLSCRLAGKAETVIRVCCGLPQLLKGDWP